ncbi:MAG: MCE family protein [Pseudonocardia sp.]|nr:MCE family protein [Pseudonocardia sp.]
MDRIREYKQITIGVVAILLIVLIGYANWPREAYSVKIVMTSAENLAVGGKVWINGFDSGWVENIETKDGKAVVTAGIASANTPLHTGTTSRVQWYAALGERILTLYPGPASNPVIPNGGLLQADSQQVELDQVLAALDEPTRRKLDGLIQSLHSTTDGRERDIQATLRSAGPAVQAAGAIFDAVGRDGPAIRSLVDQMQKMIEVAARQQNDIRGTVNGLDQFSGQVATQQRQLSDTLKELPPTLRQANDTLKAVQPAADSADAMLGDLRGATAQLPSIANDLSPMLHDLRPAIGDLRPGLESARDLLRRTPALLDNTHVVLPKARKFVTDYQPAISFLRPYTPELEGWLQNWGKNFGAYDSQTHLWAAVLGEASTQAVDEDPVTPPPIKQVGKPKPGEVIGQPWNDSDQDASGGPVR